MYFRARYYDPSTGEFITRDPLGYVDGMSMMRGCFLLNSMDPLGLCKATVDKSIDDCLVENETKAECYDCCKKHNGKLCHWYCDEWHPDPRNCTGAVNPKTIIVKGNAQTEHWNPKAPRPTELSVGSNPTPKGFNEAIRRNPEFNPESDCISVLSILAHGSPTAGVAINNTSNPGAPILEPGLITDKNAGYWFRYIKTKYCFCDPCKILLNSCNTGIDAKLSQEIAKETGCTVYAPQGYCYGGIDLENPENTVVKTKDPSQGWTEHPGSKPSVLITPPPRK